MRAIVVMFDSLNRRMLPGYGDVGIAAPNFERLAKRTAVFENCYAGSMPCMPARRELHTGRYNFLHRSWGPLEPFDDSVPEMLKQSGVYTHMVTDHQHYWEDGGATYHNRFNSYEFFRGQEGDLWKGQVGQPETPENLNPTHFLARQDWVNRQYLKDEADHPQTLTFDAGLEFMETNLDQDRWLLHLETFDPHEPFFSYDKYRQLYNPPAGEVVFDWPSYRRVTETPDEAELARAAYFALVTMCDASLGRVLDFMDENSMWDDTMLIVCTDHGFMLGEHGWWGKGVVPWYDETIHTPLYVWDPRSKVAGERREALVQTIDIGPTLLDWFELEPTKDMQGKPLQHTVATDVKIRDAALFGVHGGHVSVTDGRYVYMRSCATADNRPLVEYTLMPTHMRSRFNPQEFAGATLEPGFSFTKGAPVMKIPAWSLGSPAQFGTLLFDLENDPDQQQPLNDDVLELKMIRLLVAEMRRNEAPIEQYQRLGLPVEGEPTEEHLLVAKQWAAVQRSLVPAARSQDFPADSVVRTKRVREILANPAAREVMIATVPALAQPGYAQFIGGETVLNAVAMMPGIGVDTIQSLEDSFSGLF